MLGPMAVDPDPDRDLVLERTLDQLVTLVHP